MPEGFDWRNAASYTYLQNLEPAELAWEFLRRNADYERDFTRASQNADVATVDALTARWGLRFPDEPDTARNPGRNLLDPATDPGTLILAPPPATPDLVASDFNVER